MLSNLPGRRLCAAGDSGDSGASGSNSATAEALAGFETGYLMSFNICVAIQRHADSLIVVLCDVDHNAIDAV